MKFKNYYQWITEDYSSVESGNVSGMGPVSMPGNNSTGSGDKWPVLGEPAVQKPAQKICPECQNSMDNCICNEDN